MYGIIMILVLNNNINGTTSFWLTCVKIINAKIISSNLLGLIKHCK